jgi:phospholipid/cholesterol/gamma-HCH transport system permease protein
MDISHNPISALGRVFIFPVMKLGQMALFLAEAAFQVFTPPFQGRKWLEQLHFIGAKSMLIILLTGLFTGMVLGLQGYYTLARFGSEAVLGSAVGLSLIREMGPVLTAFMVIARGGSAMAAEIAVMRISEQIDALVTMNINPVRFLVSPRLVAAVISFPLLTAIFDSVGILGGWLTGSVLLGVESGVYFSSVQAGVESVDVNGGFIKSLVFGMSTVWICCFQGYFAHKSSTGFGSKAVAQASTSAVVFSCVAVLALDYILTSFLL